MHQLKPLLAYFKPYRRQLFWGVFNILATAWIGLLSPLVIGRAIDLLKGAVTAQRLLTYAAILLLIAIVGGLFKYLQRVILVSVSRDIEYDLRNALYTHLQTLDPAFYQRHATGDLMARSSNDLQAVRMLCGPAIMYLTNMLFTVTGALVFMLGIHRGMTLGALLVLPLVVVVTQFFGKRIHHFFQSVQESFSDLTSQVQENLAGGRVVRAYAQEDAAAAAFARQSLEYVERNRRLILWDSAFRPLLQFVVGLGYAGMLFFGGRLMLSGAITVGEFVTFNLFLGKLVWPMITIGWGINVAQRGAASMGRIQAILESMPKVRDIPPLAKVERLEGQVRFDGLDFTYEDAPSPALEGIDFSVDPGMTVAVVGRTGSGKSTLLSLIPRLVDPSPGQLYIDGVDLRHIPLSVLRGSLSVVPQETFLFSATVGENIAFGRPQAEEAEILEAARQASLDRDLESFPDGLETMVGERGITLSGGQKQRVALARALLVKPRLLLLDDCLSAVDAETEERILSNLREVFVGRTVFLVSHRITAVQAADLILVLERGRICERGTHEQLLALDGHYADLHRRQQLERQLAAVG